MMFMFTTSISSCLIVAFSSTLIKWIKKVQRQDWVLVKIMYNFDEMFFDPLQMLTTVVILYDNINNKSVEICYIL